MIKVDLITGFLGSGKTTFLKKYAKYLIDNGEKICILENDFGAVNVDMLLMQDLLSENCDIEMVAGGCDIECHKRRFKTKLISMGMRGFDRVIIEPSGIFDVDEFFDTLREEPLDNWYRIENVIAIVEATLSNNLTDKSDYLLASEIANAGKIVLSKVNKADNKMIENTILHLNRALQKIQCHREIQNAIICKNWDELTAKEFEIISNCGYQTESYQKMWIDLQKEFSSIYFLNVPITREELLKKSKEIFSDNQCGNVIRIKGFINDENGKWLEYNATKQSQMISEIEKGQNVLIIIGEKIVKDEIQKYFPQSEGTIISS